MTKRICKDCGLEFEPVSSRASQKYCEECSWDRELRARKKKYVKKQPPKYIPSQTIDEILAEMRAYNEEHGTRLTYGKYVAMKSMGKIL